MTVVLALLLLALVFCILSACTSFPLWPSVLLVIIVLLIPNLPAR